MIKSFDKLIAAVQEKPKKKIAIVSPEGTTVIKLVKQAIEANLAEFVLVGDAALRRRLREGDDRNVTHTPPACRSERRARPSARNT